MLLDWCLIRQGKGTDTGDAIDSRSWEFSQWMEEQTVYDEAKEVGCDSYSK